MPTQSHRRLTETTCSCGWKNPKPKSTQKGNTDDYRNHKKSKTLHEKLPDGTPVNVTVTDSRKGK